MIVCLCNAVSDREIHGAMREGHHTVKALARRCGAGAGQGCGGCSTTLRDMLKQHCGQTCPNRAAERRTDEASFALASGESNG